MKTASSAAERLRQGLFGLAVALGAASLTGCGPWEEPSTPASYRVAAPEPPSAEVLAQRESARAAEAQGQAGASAVAEDGSEISVGSSADEYADTDPSALTEFKPALAPYGSWVDDGTYGTVWVPREEVVGADFQPYVTAGRWTYSDSTSWVWVSDYDWGWAPFHYGRWVQIPGRGWAWIPGRVYSGAWVVWRTGPVGYDYVGWAPAAPDWYWYNGVAVGWNYGWYQPRYVYCSHHYIYQPGFSTYVVRSGPTYTAIHERTVPYTPGGGRVVASPGVAPGGGRVVANPGVAGRVTASPRVGPRPDEIGVKAPIAPPPAGHAGLAKATSFATPRTAMAQGAAAPVQTQTRPRATDALVGAPAPTANGWGRSGPAVSAFPSRGLEPAARAPQVQGVAPSPPRPASTPDWRASRSFGNDAYLAPPPSVRSPSVTASTPTPSYRPPTSSSPSWSSGPVYRAPSVSASPSTPSSSFRSSAPSVSSPPSSSFRSSAPSVSSPPVFRPSSPSPSFRSSSPSVSSPVRSAVPSSSPPRSSAPARSSGATVSRGRR